MPAARSKHEKTKDPVKSELIPPDYRKPGLGKWSFSVNGNRRFLEAAIQQCKEAATRCAESGLDEEYKIFTRRLEQLQEELQTIEQSSPNKGEA